MIGFFLRGREGRRGGEGRRCCTAMGLNGLDEKDGLGRFGRGGGMRRRRGLRGLFVFHLLAAGVVFYVGWILLGGKGAWQGTMSRVVGGGVVQDGDFCDYLEEDFGKPEVYPYNNVLRPVIDLDNRLFICVTPKSGITKVQTEFREYTKRKQNGTEPPYNYVNDVVKEFVDQYGPLKSSQLNTNFTRIFVYRNPVDRLISLYLDKFDPSRLYQAWVTKLYVQQYRTPKFELLLRNLEYFALHGYYDPHIWPQTDYCRSSITPYDHIVDIDDHESLTTLFGKYWGGKDAVDFGSFTKHATRQKTVSTVKQELRYKLHLWRKNFVRAYYNDIRFYCDVIKLSKRNAERTK